MAYTLPSGNYINVQIKYVDKDENPATVDGPVVWESSDPTIVTAIGDQVDSTVCQCTAIGPISAQHKSNRLGDADLSREGVQEIITLFDVTVVGGEAVCAHHCTDRRADTYLPWHWSTWNVHGDRGQKHEYQPAM